MPNAEARRDAGIDAVALRGRTEGELLQCKSAINGKAGWDAIKEVTAGAARYQARFAGTRVRNVAVTNQERLGSSIAVLRVPVGMDIDPPLFRPHATALGRIPPYDEPNARPIAIIRI